jgi:hypothetical protein
MHDARRAWTWYEPIHVVVYFAPEAREEYTAAGLKGMWMGYFASRSAAMGSVSASVVTATFHNFRPQMVARAIPDAWHFSTPEAVLETRLRIADRALRRLWEPSVDSEVVREAAAVMLEAASHLTPDGRPLFAVHQALPVPDPPHLALWHACTLLREHRFDGHVAALTAHGLSGLDALITGTVAKQLDPATMRSVRGWSDDEWDQGARSLRERGVLDDLGALTAEGQALLDSVEHVTDELSAQPWMQVSVARMQQALLPLVDRVRRGGGVVYPNPIGVPEPG